MDTNAPYKRKSHEYFSTRLAHSREGGYNEEKLRRCDMKKIVSILLALSLVLGLCACAEAVKTSAYYSAELNKTSNLLAVQKERSDKWYIVDANGNRVNETAFDEVNDYDSYFKVTIQNGTINRNGAVDRNGKLVVPCEYSLLDFVSDKWVVASHTVKADESNYDVKIYTSGDNEFAIVDYRDFYFEGTKVGTMNRTDYDYGYAYGDYLIVRNKAGKVNGYNKNLVKSPLECSTTSEYEEVRENGVYVKYHLGSGQKAFCPGCTLTKDEVETWLNSDSKYNFYDLQGNLVFSAGALATSVYGFNGRSCTRMSSNTGKGMLSCDGTVMIPCVYDEVNYSYPFDRFVAVNKGGKLAYYDVKNGKESYATNYPFNSCKVHNNFAWIQDLDGSIIVITPLGQLEKRYASVTYSTYSGAGLLTVLDLEGKVGVIDISGSEALPLDACFKDTYNITVSYDGSVIVAYNTNSRLDEVYTYTAPAEQNAPEAEPEKEDEPADEVSGWTCPECGSVNEGNFCPNDGTKKPEQPADSSWFCPECGSKNEGNFCPNDGTKKPA